MRTHYTMILSLIAVSILFANPPLHAADKKELQTRFEQRYPEILQFKTAGKVGETTQGVLEVVDAKDSSDSKLTALINAENSDRRELYKIIAEEEKTTPDKVAERTARRNFDKARSGEFLKGADGSWKQKS